LKAAPVLALTVGDPADAMAGPLNLKAEMAPLVADDKDPAGSNFDQLHVCSFDSEREEGLIYWSLDQDFSRGRKRSVQAIIKDTSAVHEETLAKAPMLPGLNPIGKKRVVTASVNISPEVV
jgi:hypothetical protein